HVAYVHRQADARMIRHLDDGQRFVETLQELTRREVWMARFDPQHQSRGRRVFGRMAKIPRPLSQLLAAIFIGGGTAWAYGNPGARASGQFDHAGQGMQRITVDPAWPGPVFTVVDEGRYRQIVLRRGRGQPLYPLFGSNRQVVVKDAPETGAGEGGNARCRTRSFRVVPQ